MPRLSIVIPVLGDIKRLEDTLVSVLANRPADCQVIVVLNRPYDDPYDLTDEVQFVQVEAKAGWAGCVRAGVEAATARFIHLLGCGVEVGPDWTDAAMLHFHDSEIAAVAALVLNRARPKKVLSAGVAYRAGGGIRRIAQGKRADKFAMKTFLLDNPDTRAAFYRKSALELLQRLPKALGEASAAIELAGRSNRPASAGCWSRNVRPSAISRTIATAGPLREGWDAERRFWRWMPLAGWKRGLTAHACLLAGEMLFSLLRPSNIVRLTGRLRGVLEIGGHLRHWRSSAAAPGANAARAKSSDCPRGPRRIAPGEVGGFARTALRSTGLDEVFQFTGFERVFFALVF